MPDGSHTPPRMMSDIAPPAPPPHDADILAVVEAGLEQRPADPDVMARFTAPEALAERAARDAAQRADDWPNLNRYRAANAALRQRPELVMIGDSLTEIWGRATPDLFGDSIVNRGISGQTSPQILLRFMADVVDLKPTRVHILCGGNDIAGNTGPTLPEDYQRNIRAMVELASAAGIDVLLASLTPAGTVPWNRAVRPLEWVPRLNIWLRDFAAARRLNFVDYFAALTDGAGVLQERYSADGVHVTRAAYRVMRGLLEDALRSGPGPTP